MSKSTEDDLIDITDLLRNCASQCLSYSHPFTPTNEDADADADAIQPSQNQDVTDGLGGLLKVTSLKANGDTKELQTENANKLSTTVTSSGDRMSPVNLRDAMSALELGDKRMDCCEIPLQPMNHCDDTKDYSAMYDLITHPPRIAPKNLSDGTPIEEHQLRQDANLQSSPCPSLLPYWTSLSLSPDSPTCLLPLMLLQFTSLEAYIGTNSGGSNAAETLFCCLWCHAGVIMDMAQRLDVWSELGNNPSDVGEEEKDGELIVAQWVLFASSLGAFRIAAGVRSIVQDADIYEEEDFGVEWDWEMVQLSRKENRGEIDMSTLNISDPTKVDFGFNEEDRLMNLVWGVAISKLEHYRKASVGDNVTSAMEAMILLLKAQKSFYVAIQILYNLNESNVVNFTKIAAKLSVKTVDQLKMLQSSTAIVQKCADRGLLSADGRLYDISWLSSKQKNQECKMFLSASFDPFVNRRMLGNAPIRKSRFNHIFKVIDSLINLASELEWAVCEVLLNANTLGRITRMLTNNSQRGRGGAIPAPTSDAEASAEVGINILSRSLMLLNLYFDEKLLGQYDLIDVIGQNMVQLCAVPGGLLESGWIARLSKPLYDTLKALCLDRHRERTFIEALLPAFGNLQNEAAAVDEMFREGNRLDPVTTPAYATNYVMVQTLRLMERHVGLGIELGLYPHWYDLSQAFWYRDFLLTALLNVRSTLEKERLERKVVEYQLQMEQEEEEKKIACQQHAYAQKKGGGKKKKGKKSKGSAPVNSDDVAMDIMSKITPETLEDRIDFTIQTLHRSLCRGMVRLIASLRQRSLLQDPPPTMTIFTNHKRRFVKRFDVFRELPQPPSLSFDDYQAGSDFSSVDRKNLLSSAQDCFRQGKSNVDRLLEVILPNDTTIAPTITEQRKNDDLYISIRREEIMAMAKVCVSNSLLLLKLETSLEESKAMGTLVFHAHKGYCTFLLE